MNRADFERLYREHYPRVTGLCRRLLGGAADPEDAAQEVFMRGYRALGRYRSTEPFAPWINKICANYCIDLLRKHTRTSVLFSASPVDEDQFEDPGATAVASLISAYEAELVAQAVAALPEKYRVPLVLTYYAEATYDDIASTLGITPNYVGVLLLRAKERLRVELAASDVGGSK